ncbi:MAG TPA: hypothetical protein VHO49_16545, partial [Anaerolineales bacterium]|nr:hypothetical protein [Anaerolineales bacterium]
MIKKLLIIATAVMTTLLALAALWQFRIVVLYVLISLVLAATFRPMSRGEAKLAVKEKLILFFRYVLALAVAV